MPEQPVRLWPGDPTPACPFVDDDWFRFYGAEPGTLVGTVYFEVHEYCNADRCQYRPEPCKWHPPQCNCSLGECQKPSYEPGNDNVLA